MAAVAQRTLEVTIAAAVLAASVPLCGLIALAIRIESDGPVLFRQRRLGRGMEPFTLLKFRTMRSDADEAPHREYVRSLISQRGQAPAHEESHGGLHAAPHEALYKLSVDDRVTRVGRFLRAWSLDELPQLVNVLRGDMALVGPRPVIPYEVEHYPAAYLGRFEVKPGLTGLWQVSGRNERTYDEMVRIDIEYARRRSPALDVWILLKTIPVVLSRQGVA